MAILLILPALLLLVLFGCTGYVRLLHGRVRKLYKEVNLLETCRRPLDREIDAHRRQKFAEVEATIAEKRKAVLIGLSTWSEQEKIRIQHRMDAERRELMRSVEADVVKTREKLVDQEESESVEREQAAVKALNRWVDQEKIRIGQQLEAESDTLRRLSEQKMASIHAQKSAQMDAEWIDRRKAMEIELGTWLALEQTRFQKQIDAEREEHKRSLEAEMSTVRKERLAHLEAELADRKKTAITELGTWAAGEKTRLQELLDAEADGHRRALNQELDAYKRQSLAETEGFIAEKKKSALVDLATWNEQEKARIQTLMDAEHGELVRSLEAEAVAIHRQRVAQEEIASTERKQAAIAKLGAWVSDERARLQILFDGEVRERNRSLDQEIDAYRQQKLAEVDAEIDERKKAAIAKLSMWEEQEKGRIQAVYGTEFEKVKFSLDQELDICRREGLAAIDAENTEKKRAMVAELNEWMEREKGRIQEFLDMERAELRRLLETEIATARTVGLAEVDTEITEKKQSTLAHLDEWMTQRKDALHAYLNTEREGREHALNQEIQATMVRKLDEMETELSVKKKSAAERLSEWVEQEQARLQKFFKQG